MRVNHLYAVLYKPRQTIASNLNGDALFFPFVLTGIVSSILYSLFAWQTLDGKILGINFESTGVLLIVLSLVIGFLAPFLSIIINSIIHYLAILVTGIYIEFKSLITVGIFSYVPVLIGLFVKVLFSYFSENYFFNPLAPWAGFFEQNQLLQIILSSLSITGIWSLLIYMTGVMILLRKQNNGKVKKSTFAVVLLVNIALTFVFSALTVITGNLS